MAKRRVLHWLADIRFWLTIFVIGFWPAVLLGKYLGLAILLAVMTGGLYGAQALSRRSEGTTASQ
jgi:hypothetical protein